MYQVNEIFYTIQGEARFTGTPSVFVRLQGCGVGCPWCDTKHTWDAEAKNLISADEMLQKIDDAPTYAEMTADEIVASAIKASNNQTLLITITGGEPAEQDLTELTAAISKAGMQAQLETSGTEVLAIHPDCWVTLSPKINMPNKKPIRQEAVQRADEIKMPVGKQRDVSMLQDFIADFHVTQSVWLQPLSQSEKATELCVKTAMKNGWNLSMQTHKYIGVR